MTTSSELEEEKGPDVRYCLEVTQLILDRLVELAPSLDERALSGWSLRELRAGIQAVLGRETA